MSTRGLVLPVDDPHLPPPRSPVLQKAHGGKAVAVAGELARKHRKFPWLWQFDLGKLVSPIWLTEICLFFRP